jgi:hypothetical protein
MGQAGEATSARAYGSFPSVHEQPKAALPVGKRSALTFTDKSTPSVSVSQRDTVDSPGVQRAWPS